jgi:protein-S-isoprenylcysteine O-methyltransferase Ste14
VAAGSRPFGLWVRSVVFALLLPGTVVLVVPMILASNDGGHVEIGAWNWLGTPLVAIGAAALCWCIADFARHGQGTLAPVDPPRFVVRSGLYRHVRNPMYVAVVTTLVGEALLLESAWIAAWTALVFLLVNAFVRGYEEPTLRATFGEDYEHYMRTTPRWIPRRPTTVARHDQSAG